MDVYTQIHLAFELIYHASIVAWLYFLSKDIRFVDESAQRLQTNYLIVADRLEELEHEVITLQHKSKSVQAPVQTKRKIGPVVRKK
jgi:hypothetical protein